MLATARAAGADVLLLAGDTFDNNRVGAATLDRVAGMLADAGMPVVLLPGNHDPALAGSVFHRGGLTGIANVHVLGLTHDVAVLFPEHGFEVFGHAHLDYEDMTPLRGPRPRTTRWQVRDGPRPFPSGAATAPTRYARPGSSARTRFPRPPPTTLP